MTWTQRIIYGWAALSGLLATCGFTILVHDHARNQAKAEWRRELEEFDAARAKDLKKCRMLLTDEEYGTYMYAACIEKAGRKK